MTPLPPSSEASSLIPNEPELSIALSRHDHHNLELKTRFELSPSGNSGSPQKLSRSSTPSTSSSLASLGSLELFLFLPGSVQLKTCSKSELISDFYSRARLSFSRDAQGDLKLLEREIEALQRTLPTSEPEAIFNQTKRLGAVFGETIRHVGSQQKRALLLIHSRAAFATDPSSELVLIADQIRALSRLTHQLRALCQATESQGTPVLSLLDDYAHQTFVHYLAGTSAEFEKMRAACEKREQENPGRAESPQLGHLDHPYLAYQKGWTYFESTLIQLKSQVALSSKNKAKNWSDEIERELHLVRLSQMKKFFQSDMFVDIARRESLKKFSEPLAAGAAGFAALWAVLFQRWADPTWVDVGFRGVFVIGTAITFYVLRDRLKELGREFITRNLARVVPDIQQDLIAEGTVVGRIAEWFTTKKPEQLPEEIRVTRASACLTEAEKHLPEDVLHYRRSFTLNELPARKASGVAFSTAGPSHWALLEVQRINLERHLKHLDDPYKTYRFLDANGDFSVHRSHRVYYFYTCVSARTQSASGETRRFQRFFRIVMDKNGIDRVEQI